VQVFENYSRDFEHFRAIQQPTHSEEVEVLLLLDQVAATAVERLQAANAALKMYEAILCKPDRAKAARFLKGQLEYYSWAFGSEVTRTTAVLNFGKVPATVAQTGLQMNHALQSAKEKLDTIAASLTPRDPRLREPEHLDPSPRNPNPKDPSNVVGQNSAFPAHERVGT
jgi:hypothetical protein